MLSLKYKKNRFLGPMYFFNEYAKRCVKRIKTDYELSRKTLSNLYLSNSLRIKKNLVCRKNGQKNLVTQIHYLNLSRF